MRRWSVCRIALIPLAASAAAGAPGTARCAAAQATPAAPVLRLAGEYGLSATVSRDSMVVRWLTRQAAAGFAQVWVDGKMQAATSTPIGTAHHFAFKRPAANELALRFGGMGDDGDLHEAVFDIERIARRRTVWPEADSIFVISDVHGEFDRMTAVLRKAGLIDERLRWTGGRRHLVVLGDVFDRGPDATRALWFLYNLEHEAGHSDGRVHVMLGNHEIMIMLDDLRYVSEKEREVARLHGTGYAALFDPRTSVLGRWLASRPAVLRIGDVLFAHGGVSSDYLGWKIQEIDDTLAAYTGEELFARWNDTTYIPPIDSAAYDRRWRFFSDPRSLFWYRGYVQSDTTEAELDAVLEAYGARIMVVGHTPGPAIRERFAGKLIAVNTLPFANEVLLIVRHGDDDWERFRIGESGAPIPLDPNHPRHDRPEEPDP
jgi:predicted phosphodiesterase